MTDERWVALGLAHPRAGWFSELARWSMTGAVPVEFVKCISPDEVRARLTGGRAYSALLVGGDVVGLDRDLVDRARDAGASVVVVDPVADRDWRELGVAAVLPGLVERADLLAVLTEHARPVPRIATAPVGADPPSDEAAGPRGRLVAVTGPGGCGTSVIAMGLAQTFAAETGPVRGVCLADLALDAEQGMLHDSRELMPGIQELVDAHRTGRLPVDQVRALTFEAFDRGYDLLLGLRRHRDWTAIGPRAFAAALDSLRRSYQVVVADIDPDVEGETLTGSIDIEDRNTMARATATSADLVVVVGVSSTKGLHALSRTIRLLVSADVAAGHIVPVCNRAARRPRHRAETAAALASLLGPDGFGDRVGNPVFVADRSDVEDSIRDGVRLPSMLGRRLHAELARRLEGCGPASPPRPDDPVPVQPGSLGHWAEHGG
jgi:MinD-like ATPase involved in chromosome partitioning or flagellar assembly